MRKQLFGAALAISLCFTFISSPAASAAVPITFSGVITKKGQPAPGEPVTLRCKAVGESMETFVDVYYANNNGQYTMTTNSSRCPLGSFAHLLHAIDIGEHFDTSVSTVVKVNNIVNMEIGTVTYPIPEFSVVGGMTGTTAAIGAVLFIRRKQASIVS